MVKVFYRNLKSSKMTSPTKPKRGCWLMAYDMDSEDIALLQDLGFDGDLIEDANDYFEVPRFEYVNDTVYLYTRYPVDRGRRGELSTAPILISISQNYLLTLTHRNPDFLSDMIERNSKVVTTQKTKTMLLILTRIAEMYDRSLMSTRRTLLKYFGKVENVSEDDLKNILEIQNRLADYLSALIPTLKALDTMINKSGKFRLHKDDIEILSDLIQDIEQSIDTARSVAKTSQNIRSTHEIIIGHQLNDTMKTLTALTVIFTIPTIMTGLFGMNTWLPAGNGPLSFIIIVAVTGIIALIVAKFLRWKRWF